MMGQHVDTLVIGGGQAGLSASWHLKRKGREHVVFDRGKVGDTCRHRWDSFCLVTPNWTCRLSGFPYDGDEPDDFMKRDQTLASIERFAKSFGPPYRAGVEVRRLTSLRDGERFLLDTSESIFSADNVIIATGTFQHPNLPVWRSDLADDIVQLHTRDYRNPERLPEGAVLVVGSGQSRCQVAEALHEIGREVHLSVGRVRRIPRRYRGRNILQWFKAAGLFEVPVDEHSEGHAAPFRPHAHLSGRDGGRTIDLRRLALDGVKLNGRLVNAERHRVFFADDLAEKLDAADEACRKQI